jgi:hypothetical protein
MREETRTLYLLSGLWLSLLALVFVFLQLLPSGGFIPEAQQSLLYAFDSRPLPSSVISTASKEEKTLLADLQAMQLHLYEGGVLTKTFPILSRGREGTFWETPKGKYAIQMKEIRHYSSIGGVWMPYSMQFYGNFFLHGWPTYTDGTEVPPGYSGGCIRLATDDAKEVYEFAPVGTRLIIEGAMPTEAFATTSRYYLRITDGDLGDVPGRTDEPNVTARSLYVADQKDGTILWERSADVPRRPGKMIALVSALTALETVNQYKIVRMSELLLGKSVLRRAPIGEDDELPVGALIYPLIFDANDTAAKAFAREHGTKQFVSYMNEKTRAIGMASSSWGGPLSSDEATTTARDLGGLLGYVFENKRFLVDVMRARDRELSSENGQKQYAWTNDNPWVIEGDASYRGGLAELNEDGSGSAMLLFDLPLSEFGDRTVIMIIMDSKDLLGDVKRLREFVIEHYVYGIERTDSLFHREETERKGSLLERAKELIDLRAILEDKVQYERDV